MRATCRVRSRSTSAAGAVQVRTRPTDRRTKIRQRQPCEACLRVPLGTLRLAGANLHPHVACSAPHVPLPLGGSEGAQPLAAFHVPQARRTPPSAGKLGPSESPYPYNEKPDYGPVNKGNQRIIPRFPAMYRSPAMLR